MHIHVYTFKSRFRHMTGKKSSVPLGHIPLSKNFNIFYKSQRGMEFRNFDHATCLNNLFSFIFNTRWAKISARMTSSVGNMHRRSKLSTQICIYPFSVPAIASRARHYRYLRYYYDFVHKRRRTTRFYCILFDNICILLQCFDLQSLFCI